jgi:indole-3-glycerol phosphate synthase
MNTPDILARIVAHKRSEIAELQVQAAREGWVEQAQAAPTVADFQSALASFPTIRAIAEIKKASPSAGVIRADFDPPALAQSYAAGGAACLSVLTDSRFFSGSIDDLMQVHAAVPLPLLRKDFVLDAVQIYQARLAGASAVLLIAECLASGELTELLAEAQRIGLAALVELYEPANLRVVLDAGARIVGINNRNLRTFETDLRHTLDLLPDIPNDRIVVSESGIKTRADVLRLEEAGVDAILVGESLMRAADPGQKLAELLGQRNAPAGNSP